jgi:hypothetical protein
MKNYITKLLTKNKISSNYSEIVKNNQCSELEIDKWRLSEFIVDTIVPKVGFEPYPLDEIFLMCSAVLLFKPTHIFEWGTHLGRSARIFHEINSRFNVNAEIHSFDLPDDVSHVEHPGNNRAIFLKNIDSVFLYQEDGLVKSPTIFNTSTIENKRALFYLDGDHSYKTVENELRTINENIDNPIFLLHDTFFQSKDSKYNTGPYDALNDFILLNPSYVVVNTNFGLPGMSLVYKK